MHISGRYRSIDINGARVELSRTSDGVMRLRADDDLGLARGLGFAHAHDRMVQMMVVRLAGQGRLCECLMSDDDALAIDVFMRGMGLRREAEKEVGRLGAGARLLAEAYAEGVNSYLQAKRRPLELALVRYRPEPWTVADTLLTIKLMSYFGLAQSQQDMEKYLIQALGAGVPAVRLKKLVAPHLDGLDDGVVEKLGELRFVQPLLPESVRFLTSTPTVMASNNWAVAGSRTSSGMPIQCNDPHLECNRLPAVWYETVMHTRDDYRLGATMPGIPGLIMGRTGRLSFGFTYGFMDMVDYFLEDCRDGACRRGDDYLPFEVRTETIRRKGEEPVRITVRENDLGVLEADPLAAELSDGFYLTRAWSAHRGGAARSLEALSRLADAKTVPEAQVVVREVTISCNWLLADREGNIGYQQSGLLPDRRHSGLYPVPAWDERWHWRGLVPSERLHSVLNPSEGFLATANDDHNPPGGPLVINLPMGAYRADRILGLLSDNTSCTLEDMEQIQNDLYSLQAERFMEILRPLLPPTFAGRMLAGWDLRYDAASRGATLFETVYHALLREVFGRGLFGEAAWEATVASTAILADYYHLFDNILLGDDPSWFGMEGRQRLFSRVLEEILTDVDLDAITPWGRRQQMVMKNIFFEGRLPLWLGFDHGPIELQGNRATVVQGGVFTSHNRQTTFTPSWRFITDLGDDSARTALAGGPSGRRFSRWYTTDIKRWLEGRYKTLTER
ncbi:MAG: penicillin acylase family protein [Acidobacteria bacterium]|nr:penicillin acylase family protein [Candidatus Sulfomarinibacter sp. MAG AM1]